MKYELKTLKNIGPRLQKIHHAEIGAAISCLSGLNSSNALTRTHEARKHFKRIRALLRLVRDGLGDEVYGRENACFRTLGRQLCALRDAQVLVQALDGLRKRTSNNHSSMAFTRTRKALIAEEHRTLKQLLKGGVHQQIVAELEAAQARATEWLLRDFGWKETRRALRHTYRCARRAAKEANAAPDVEKLHECRKRVKDLLYHVRLICPLAPEYFRLLVTELESLSDILGDDHDLAVLQSALGKSLRQRGSGQQALVRHIAMERTEKTNAACALSARLLKPSSAQFSRDLKEQAKHHRKARRQAAAVESLLTRARS